MQSCFGVRRRARQACKTLTMGLFDPAFGKEIMCCNPNKHHSHRASRQSLGAIQKSSFEILLAQRADGFDRAVAGTKLGQLNATRAVERRTAVAAKIATVEGSVGRPPLATVQADGANRADKLLCFLLGSSEATVMPQPFAAVAVFAGPDNFRFD